MTILYLFVCLEDVKTDLSPNGFRGIEYSMEQRKIIDVHAHVLPGIDDGARNLEESCCLLERAVSQGISCVVATPHDSAHQKPEMLRKLTAEVEREFRRRYPDFALYLGQEIFFHEEVPEKLKAGELLTIADSRYVLVEFAVDVPYGSLCRGIRRLVTAGYFPVLAHMERYVCLRIERNLTDLEGSGCLFQMNYESLQGSRFRADVRWCRRQALAGRIQYLGTDMHRTDYRSPNIEGALEWAGRHMDEALLDEMTRKNPLHMLQAAGQERDT